MLMLTQVQALESESIIDFKMLLIQFESLLPSNVLISTTMYMLDSGIIIVL